MSGPSTVPNDPDYQRKPSAIHWFQRIDLGVVLFSMKHSLLAHEKVGSVTQEIARVEVQVDLLDVRVLATAFYPNKFHKDAADSVGPDPVGVVAMPKVAGFAWAEIVSRLCSVFFRLARAAYCGYERRQPFWQFARTDRIVVHAWK